MLIPAPRLLGLALLLALGGVLVSLLPAWQLPALGVLAALVLVLALDAFALLRRALPRVERRVAHAFALGVAREVRLEVVAGDARTLVAEVTDHLPAHFGAEGLPRAIRIEPGSGASIGYRATPFERGEHRFEPPELRIASRLGFWQRRVRAGTASAVRVLPNFAALTRFALFATDHRLSQLGVLKRRRRGQGLDFHQLREYREGDSERQIDWKASARSGRLISREYQDERDQQILLVVDCGRRMAARDGPLTHLDRALDAAMLLAFVALRQGDAVGLATLGGDERWLAPRKSRAMMNTLLDQAFDLRPSLRTPDFVELASNIRIRQRKRALIVLLTNLRDEDDDSLDEALALLRERHLVLIASLREPILDAALRGEVKTLDDALTHAATAQYLEQRRRAFRRLEATHVPAVDVEPAALPMALVNRYLDLKRSGRM